MPGCMGLVRGAPTSPAAHGQEGSLKGDVGFRRVPASSRGGPPPLPLPLQAWVLAEPLIFPRALTWALRLDRTFASEVSPCPALCNLGSSANWQVVQFLLHGQETEAPGQSQVVFLWHHWGLLAR